MYITDSKRTSLELQDNIICTFTLSTECANRQLENHNFTVIQRPCQI